MKLSEVTLCLLHFSALKITQMRFVVRMEVNIKLIFYPNDRGISFHLSVGTHLPNDMAACPGKQ